MSNNLTSSEGEGKFLDKTITDPCVHCGFCLPSCASYRVLGTEMDSPRGRIHLLKAIDQGELVLDSNVASHFDSCLGCLACVTACPSGVRYDKLIEATRPLLNKQGLRTPCENLFRNLLLKLLPYPKRLRILLANLKVYAGSPIQKFARNTHLTKLFGPQLEAMEALLPRLTKESFVDSFPVINQALGPRRGRVGLVLGCVQRCFDPYVNTATIAVLQANGWEVFIPSEQGCCGAVAHHQGEMEKTKELAINLIKSFASLNQKVKEIKDEPLEAVLIAASGCGHTMKSFDQITSLEATFEAPVFDVHEFLAKKGLSEEFRKSLQPLVHKDGEIAHSMHPIQVVFHDACHMIHGQGIFKEPRELLNAIPYLEIKEPIDAGICCGSAGIYNLIKPNEATELGKMKVSDLNQTGAKIILSANIGCSLQIRRYINQDQIVIHPMELLAHAAKLHKIPGL